MLSLLFYYVLGMHILCTKIAQNINKKGVAMDYKTHLLGGAGMAYATTQIFILDPKQTILLYGFSLLGSILPDIDHPKAFISHFVPVIPNLINVAVGHRTFTHSLLFTFICLIIGWMFNPVIGIGLALGIISHILLDLLTPYGVAFLYPFKRDRIILNNHTKN